MKSDSSWVKYTVSNKKYITEQDLEPEIGTVIPTIKLASINTGTGDLFPLVWALVDDM